MIGRKTYLLSGSLLVALLVLVATGHLTPQTAAVLVMIAAFGFPVTLRAALAHHQDEVVELLEEIATTGAAVASHNLPGALGAGRQVFESGEKLADECKQEGAGA